ncbi:MAG: hypothetical protein ABI369_02025, partial [Acetobacteraceae bacterium]
MQPEFAAPLAAVAAGAAIIALLVLLRGGAAVQRLRILAEQNLVGTQSLRGGLDAGMEQVRTVLAREQGELRLALAEVQRRGAEDMGRQLREMREGNEAKLAEIQRTVNEQLHAAVEKQMNDSFARVIDQFTAVQKAMGDV